MSLTTENQLKTTLDQCKKALLLVIAFSCVINLLVLAVPIYMLQIYDRVIGSRSIDTLLLLTVITVFALLTMAVLESVRTRVMVRIGAWFDQSLSPDILSGSIAAQLRQGISASVQSLRDVAAIRGFIGGNSVIPALMHLDASVSDVRFLLAPNSWPYRDYRCCHSFHHCPSE